VRSGLRQILAVLKVCARELAWVRPGVAHELERWRRWAAAIPDPVIRADALASLRAKRLNAEGAALFAAVAPRRNSSLLRLLVAYQVLLDFLDTLTERPAAEPLADGRQLHLALEHALDPDGPIEDYYRHHPRRADAGYIRALVQTCRDCSRRLPAYGEVRHALLQAAERCGVQGLNHDPDARRRDSGLRRWAQRTYPGATGISWWELTAAASSTVGIHALLALAADPSCARRDAVEVATAYMPWICALSTMLDSYVDEAQDVANDDHSYLGHYPSRRVAEERISELLARARQEVRRLRNGSRHALVLAGMVAMYLSADAARTAGKRSTTRALTRAGGALTRMLLPVLRLWRIALQLRDA
jgi:tetraprenyl-beta-curcumene synthase